MSHNSFAEIENLGEGDDFQIEEFTWDTKPKINVGTIENFQEQPKIAAKHLSFMGEHCLNFIKNNPVFQEKYRIVLSPENGAWNLYLHLDPVAWFDALISRQNETRESVMQKAREYVNNVRGAYSPSRPEKFVYLPVLSKTYCTHHGKCVRGEYLIDTMQALNAETNINSITDNRNCPYHVEIPKIYCQTMPPQQKRLSHLCNWYVEQERIVPFDDRRNKPLAEYILKSSDKWIVTSRLEHIRELLVFPTKHKTNKDLIKSEGFWAWVLDDLVIKFLGGFSFNPGEYPLESFAMNFGGWESENAKDKNAVDCHGHLHLYLKLDVVRNMEPKYPSIRGKVNDPYEYGLLDCTVLETYRLHSLEISEVKGIKDEIKEIKEEVKGIKDEIKEIKDEVKGIKNELKEIKEEVKGIKHTLDRILEYLKLQK